MVTSLKSLRLEEVVPYLVTICFKISGVIGSFLCIVWPTVLITPSFTRCYKNAFEKWCKWCVSVKLPSFPATEFHVSLYLIHLSDLRKSVSSINEVFYSISWAHWNNNIFSFSINICFTFFNVQINMIRIKLYVRTFEIYQLWKS
jgi:hypothetical protein